MFVLQNDDDAAADDDGDVGDEHHLSNRISSSSKADIDRNIDRWMKEDPKRKKHEKRNILKKEIRKISGPRERKGRERVRM